MDASLSLSLLRARWQETDVLVFDEGSTFDVKAFCDAHILAKHMLNPDDQARKKDQRAFGGMQVIVAADFYGLPPVTDCKNFIFQSAPWVKAQFEYVELTKDWRRAADPQMAALVRNARTGKFTPSDMAFFRSRIGMEAQDDGIFPTILTASRDTAEAENDRWRKRLSGAYRPAKKFPRHNHESFLCGVSSSCVSVAAN